MGRRSYSELYEAIQEAFDPEDMTEERIKQWIYHGETGKHEVKWGKDRKGQQRYREVEGKPISSKAQNLAEELSKVSNLLGQIQDANTTKDLDEIYQEVKDLKVHSSTLTSKIDDKKKILKKEEDKVQKELEAQQEKERQKEEEQKQKAAEEMEEKIDSQLEDIEEKASEIQEDITGFEEQQLAAEEGLLSKTEARNLEKAIEESQSKKERLLDKYESILEQTTDKRKRANAKRRLQKLRE